MFFFNLKVIMTLSPLIWLQNRDTDVWEKVMIELVKCRKKKVHEEFEQKWKEFKTTQGSWYDWMRWTNSRNYIKFITKYKYNICGSDVIDYEFSNKLFVYGFEISVIQPEEYDINLIYHISSCYNLETKVEYLIKSNNKLDDGSSEILRIYSNDKFKQMCLQEEKDNWIIYCDIEKRYIMNRSLFKILYPKTKEK